MQTIRDPLQGLINSPLYYFLIYGYNDRIFRGKFLPFCVSWKKQNSSFLWKRFRKLFQVSFSYRLLSIQLFPRKLSTKNFGYMRKKVRTLLEVHVTGQIIFGQGKKAPWVEKKGSVFERILTASHISQERASKLTKANEIFHNFPRFSRKT